MPRLFLTALAVLATIAVAVRAQPPAIRVGEAFPALVFPSLDDGKPMSITDFHGSKTVLVVFASW